ncbi:hypothetical protein [Allosphingosinicella deserti]|uniref:UrcA family protein n=1 Tax=Allosphingosinicella deserti TaxID=2116704 RepID=A0A2P7QFU3_9SPHN|nr:hypothetical protein [Sphingomonas deserti]PSJ36820.1 hypothetical protein C7I55_24205 [Sphingomonas deserti]
MTRLLLLALLASACTAAGPGAKVEAGAGALPPDVRAFITRRDGCDHFRGEEGYDAARRKQIEAQLKRLCTGTDAELARLKRAHAANRLVQAALADYDDNIE